MKRWFIFALVLFATMTVYAVQNKPLIVVLDWFINPTHAPLFVAEQEGFFKAEDLAVKFIAPADPSEGVKMVAVGQADIALTYQPTLLHKITAGLPIVRFATLVDQPLDAILVLKNSSINSVKDLKSKLIGYSDLGTDHLMLRTILAHNNLDLKDVNLINVKFDATQALLAGKIDAFIGGLRTFEPIEMELAGKPARMFYPEQNGFPSYEELILVTQKNQVNDPRLTKFIAAVQQGVKYIEAHPQASWQKFVQNHPELNNELNKKAWFATLPYFAKSPGKLDVTKYNTFAAFMYKHGLIAKVPRIEEYAVSK